MGKSVYLDSISGSDSSDGLSIESAKGTWAAAYALLTNNSDDELVIVGDLSLGAEVEMTVAKRGISADRRLTIRGHMPDGATRPVITRTADGSAGYVFRLHSDPYASDYTCIRDLDLNGDNKSGSGGISIYTTGGGMLFKNVRIRNMRRNGVNISGGGPGNNLSTAVMFQRCQIYDCNRIGGGPHVQGVYAEYCENVTFEDCLVDHNGRLQADDSGTIFNHNFYFHSSCANMTVRNTISARASATGIQHRKNAHHSIGNLVIDCPLGITFGHDDYGGSYPTQYVSGTCTGNAVIGATDIASGTPRKGPAIGFGYANGITIDDNIIAHCEDAGYSAIRTDRPSTNVTVTDTRVYNWGQPAYSVGGTADPDEPTVSVEAETTTPVATIADYLTSLGVTPGVDPHDTFLDLCRDNSDGAWDSRWTAVAVNAFLRGTTVDPGTDPDEPPVPVTVNDDLFHDRRPHVITIPFGANYGNNVQGLDPNWISTPANRIAAARLTAKRCGAPFIWLHMPAGSLASPNNYCASTDGVLPANVLTYFTSTFKPQPLAGGGGEHERWYIYHGRLMPVNGQQDSQVTSPDNEFGTTEADAQFTADAIDLFGSRGFWGNGVDASSDNATYAETIRATALWSKEVWCEALPLLTSPWRVDTSKITLAPYLCLDSYIATRDPSNTFRFNKRTTKVVYFLDDAVRATTSYVDDLIARGVIPGVVHGVTPDATQEYIKSRYTSRLPTQGTGAAF